jgi:hypothetical protein
LGDLGDLKTPGFIETGDVTKDRLRRRLTFRVRWWSTKAGGRRARNGRRLADPKADGSRLARSSRATPLANTTLRLVSELVDESTRNRPNSAAFSPRTPPHPPCAVRLRIAHAPRIHIGNGWHESLGRTTPPERPSHVRCAIGDMRLAMCDARRALISRAKPRALAYTHCGWGSLPGVVTLEPPDHTAAWQHGFLRASHCSPFLPCLLFPPFPPLRLKAANWLSPPACG